ncbi:Ig-like domain-containing protein [Paenibacillus qinlingensis]|uniref:BIG2 domain-containing protein n=1 Tax=Paenibacillus qinlingensis TaxID=1837343 RepID=A0ABU1NTP8_9BACL|nr:Ig-like domain-containing protein [Paenibacillus qinlingensis]MDR6550431.1 hypothetical protein [Paenibacillus qinlingensis]
MFGRKMFAASLSLAIICSLAIVGVPKALAAATDYYVSSTGSDSNPGTMAQPFLTILKASQAAAPGTTVHVLPGTYTGGFQTKANGMASARIRYVSDVLWGARLVPPAVNASGYVWDNQGSYVDIEGFEVDGNGSDTRNGLYNEGSYVGIKNNHVHDIATNIPCTGSGGAAINTDYYHYGVETEISGNIVHNIGYAGCSFIQGIYVSTSGTVKNNLVYQNGGAALHLWHDANHVTIANNTIFSSWFGMVIGGGDFWHTQGPAEEIHVSNNIVFDNSYGISEQGKTGTNNTYTNNLIFQNSIYDLSLQNGLTAVGTISANPQFVYYDSAGGGNYHIKYTSPAIDSGVPDDAPAVDLDGKTRPRGAGFDIGAYEYDPNGFTIQAVSRALRIGETTQIVSSYDLSGALYTSDNPAVAMVNGNGLVTAVSNGVANITAVVGGNGTPKSSAVLIKVAERLQSISLQTGDPTPEIGQTQKYMVAGLMSDGSAANLSAASIRYYMKGNTIASVSSTGLVTGINSGMDTLNVDVTLDGVTKRMNISVTIAAPTIASVALSAPSSSLVKGQTTQLAVAGTATNGKPASLKTSTIAYQSSNTAVATVSTAGLVTAISPGTAILKANVTLNGVTLSATFTITVQPGLSVITGFTKLPLIAKTTGTIIYAPTLQFEANQAGESITFGVDVPETHLYQLRMTTFKATSYGKYSIKLDGQSLSDYNFYGSTGRSTVFEPIGSMQLTKGVHQLTFLNIGKNEESTNYKMGVIDLELLAMPDSIPPVTSAGVQGNIHNGWFTSDVTISLSAADDDTGVNRTEYRLDDAADWSTYSGPITITTDGAHTLAYRSIDAAGNVEQAKVLPINIDQTAPVLTVTLDPSSLWPPNHKMVTIHAQPSAVDTASEIAAITLTSITSNETDAGDVDIIANIGSTDVTFQLRAERNGNGNGRIYTVTYTAVDQAGHQTSASATVSIPHDQSNAQQ